MNDENFMLISALSVPLGFNITLVSEKDTLTVSGNNDCDLLAGGGNIHPVSVAAAVMGLTLKMKWSEATQVTIMVMWRQYLVQVLRSFANGIEANHFTFVGINENGMLKMEYRRPE